MLMMKLDNKCNEVIEFTKKLCEKLRNGEILSSTEAAFTVLDVLVRASEVCKTHYNEYLIVWLPKILRSRPTSQLLINSLRQFLHQYIHIARCKGLDEALSNVKGIVQSIKEGIDKEVALIALIGSRRIIDGDVILTHSFSKTLIEVFRRARDEGIKFSVYVTESRPIGEGLITASTLAKLRIKTTLIIDSAVRYVMKRVTKVFIGADAIATNGAVVNKIGTSAIALAAKESRVRVYVTASTRKFSFETVFGELVEGPVLNNPDAIIPKEWLNKLSSRVRTKAPLFDVTPPEYIDAIITEVGLLAPQAIPILIKEVYGWPPKIIDINELINEVKDLD
ncbi:MAG: initiation factor 2B [Desulfurococcales archaeon ex4484_42]|nr:MAG: initiation factor 2B [Desulfurococcales archaeon ex4484_42]